MSELKPCPYCKGKATIDLDDSWVFCEDCGFGIEIVEPSFPTIETLIEHWNTRPIEDTLNAQIKEQGELIEKLAGAINKTFNFSVNLKPASEYDGRQIGKLSAILNKALSAYKEWKGKQK